MRRGDVSASGVPGAGCVPVGVCGLERQVSGAADTATLTVLVKHSRTFPPWALRPRHRFEMLGPGPVIKCFPRTDEEAIRISAARTKSKYPDMPSVQQKATPLSPPSLPTYKAASSSSGASSNSKWQKLILTTTSLRNVVLANASDVIYYEVITPKWARGSTTVSRLDPNTHQFDVVGEMRNDERGKAAEVRLYGGAVRAVGDFLRGDEGAGEGGKSEYRCVC